MDKPVTVDAERPVRIRVEFDSGSGQLPAVSQVALKEYGAYLVSYMHKDKAFNIILSGYTDSDQYAADSGMTNQRLSEQRAASVEGAIESGMVNGLAGRIDSVGRGASRPIEDNSGHENKQASRRVEVGYRL